MEAPWNHPTRTHMAPLCHLDRALPLERLRFHDDGTMRALGLHHRNTLATRIRHRDSTVPGRKEPQRTPVPNPIRPILCAGWPSTKNGAAEPDFGRNRARRHPGDKAARSCVRSDGSFCGHLPRCRHSRSCGLLRWRYLGAIQPAGSKILEVMPSVPQPALCNGVFPPPPNPSWSALQGAPPARATHRPPRAAPVRCASKCLAELCAAAAV